MPVTSKTPKPKKQKKRSRCPIAFALDLIGDRWTLLVLRDLIIVQKRHFREFLDSPEGIASNILTDRLRRLECAAILTREPDPDNARQVVYAPTRKGLDLLPVMLEMVSWSAKYDADTAAPAPFVARIRSDRNAVIAELTAPHSNSH